MVAVTPDGATQVERLPLASKVSVVASLYFSV